MLSVLRWALLWLWLWLWPGLGQAGRMEVLYSWSQVDFTFPSHAVREFYLANGQFIPKNNAILDVDVWGGHRGLGRKVFVTLPKLKEGVPVTLATVTDLRRNHTALLQPYPDWSWHQGDCSGITSVYRTQVDKCGRLWVLDCGTVNTLLDQPQRICPPQILVFDLDTDQLIHRHRFPKSVLDDDSLLITIKVDSRAPDCSDIMAYVSDVVGYKLIVHDAANAQSWRISSNLFYPYPLHGDFHINGVDFDLMDGIFGLAVGPIRNNGDRTLYFHSFASVHESWVSTSVIRNQSLFEDDIAASPRSFRVFEDTRRSQSTAQDMTDSGVLLYAAVDNSIGCWNTRLPFRRQNLETIAKDDVTLQFQSGLKVYGNLVWTLSSRLQNYVIDEVPTGEVNYRINVGRVSDLIRHTRCEVRQHRDLEPALVFPVPLP